MAIIQDYQAKIDELMELINELNKQIKENTSIIDSLQTRLGL